MKTLRMRLAAALAPALVLASAPALAAPNDFDRDGRSDIALHRPGSGWTTVPTLLSNGNGTWREMNSAPTPAWANQDGVVAIPGDFNGDGRPDLAFHRPAASSWSSVPVLFRTAAGGWTQTNFAAPAWANEPGVIAVPGHYNRDTRTDIAFVRPGSKWTTVPVLMSVGTGAWTAFTSPAEFASQHGAVAVPGDFNGDGLADLAFHRPGSTWNSVPVLFANAAGGWRPTNFVAPDWANQGGAVAVPGDYNADGRTDIAFHRPDGTWQSVPVLTASATTEGAWGSFNQVAPVWANETGAIAIPGDFNNDRRADLAFHKPGGGWTTVPVLLASGAAGGWTTSAAAAPEWANQLGAVAIPGDFNADGRTDVAFHKPGGTWNTVPVLFRTSAGAWTGTNLAAPTYVHQSGVVAVPRAAKRTFVAQSMAIVDAGDEGYDMSQEEDDELREAFEAWMNVLRLIVQIVEGYQAYVHQAGLTGRYEGSVWNGHSSAAAYLDLRHAGTSVDGAIVILDPTLRMNGGVCSDVVVPVSQLPVHALSSDLHHATGTSSRDVDFLGVFSGSVDTTFTMAMEETEHRWLTGTIHLDVPWPCADQDLSFRFDRYPL